MKTIVFDFDGVIHSYRSGWKGTTIIPDPPVDGIKETIDNLRKIYKVVVVSSRSSSEEGRNAIMEWLKKYNIVVDNVVSHKPPALVYIDDRAICFDGDAHKLEQQIKNFKNWLGK